jgi:hypothetical protein
MDLEEAGGPCGKSTAVAITSEATDMFSWYAEPFSVGLRMRLLGPFAVGGGRLLLTIKFHSSGTWLGRPLVPPDWSLVNSLVSDTDLELLLWLVGDCNSIIESNCGEGEQ